MKRKSANASTNITTSARDNVCAQCGAQFPTWKALRAHGRIHSNRRLNCQACGRLFAYSAKLADHTCTPKKRSFRNTRRNSAQDRSTVQNVISFSSTSDEETLTAVKEKIADEETLLSLKEKAAKDLQRAVSESEDDRKTLASLRVVPQPMTSEDEPVLTLRHRLPLEMIQKHPTTSVSQSIHENGINVATSTADSPKSHEGVSENENELPAIQAALENPQRPMETIPPVATKRRRDRSSGVPFQDQSEIQVIPSATGGSHNEPCSQEVSVSQLAPVDDPTKYTCDKCNRVFRTETRYIRHCEQKHDTLEKQSSTSEMTRKSTELTPSNGKRESHRIVEGPELISGSAKFVMNEETSREPELSPIPPPFSPCDDAVTETRLEDGVGTPRTYGEAPSSAAMSGMVRESTDARKLKYPREGCELPFLSEAKYEQKRRETPEVSNSSVPHISVALDAQEMFRVDDDQDLPSHIHEIPSLADGGQPLASQDDDHRRIPPPFPEYETGELAAGVLPSVEPGKPIPFTATQNSQTGADSSNRKRKKTPTLNVDANSKSGNLGIVNKRTANYTAKRRRKTGAQSEPKVVEPEPEQPEVPIVINEKGRYVCEFCDLQFSSEVKYTRHFKRLHGEVVTTVPVQSKATGDFACSLCESKVPSDRALKTHVRRYHKESVESWLEFIHENQAVIENVHIDQIAAEVEVVPPSEIQEERRTRSRRKQRVPSRYGDFETPLSDPVSVDDSSETHDQSYLPESEEVPKTRGIKTLTQCDECLQVFEKEREAVLHMMQVHNMEPPPHLTKVVRSHTCDHCGRAFRLMRELQLHIRKYHDPDHEAKEYSCSSCNKKFFNRHSLLFHRRIKCGEPIRDFQCECGRLFAFAHNLSTHKKNHCPLTKDTRPKKSRLPYDSTKQYPFRCSRCPDRFTNKRNLLIHKLNSHGEESEGLKCFRCLYCSQGFAARAKLFSHLRCARDLIHPDFRKTNEIDEQTLLKYDESDHKRSKSSNSKSSKPETKCPDVSSRPTMRRKKTRSLGAPRKPSKRLNPARAAVTDADITKDEMKSSHSVHGDGTVTDDTNVIQLPERQETTNADVNEAEEMNDAIKCCNSTDEDEPPENMHDVDEMQPEFQPAEPDDHDTVDDLDEAGNDDQCECSSEPGGSRPAEDRDADVETSGLSIVCDRCSCPIPEQELVTHFEICELPVVKPEYLEPPVSCCDWCDKIFSCHTKLQAHITRRHFSEIED